MLTKAISEWVRLGDTENHYETRFWCAIDFRVNNLQFSVTKGTRQGGVLSPYLFLCFIDDLLHELCSSNMGLSIHGVNVCCPTVADDMLLQALTKFGLQVLISICVRYFHMWRLEHNALKCNVLVCNETDAEYKRSNRRWMLGTEDLPMDAWYRGFTRNR